MAKESGQLLLRDVILGSYCHTLQSGEASHFNMHIKREGIYRMYLTMGVRKQPINFFLKYT